MSHREGSQCRRQGEEETKDINGDRRRVLIDPVQHLEDGSPRQNVNYELMLEFVRALVRNTSSGDVIMLSIYAARSRSGASDEEVSLLIDAIEHEQSRLAAYPEDSEVSDLR